MSLDDPRRAVFAELCALVLPAWAHMPSADGLDLEYRYLDTVCRTRPDLEQALPEILERLPSPLRRRDLEALQQRAPADLQTLVTAVCGAYYLHPRVKTALGYGGQQALSLTKGGFGAEDLVMKMMGQPKRYRGYGEVTRTADAETE